MNYKEILKILQKDGWYQVRQEGSHRQFHHPEKKGTVTVAYHKIGDEIPPKTLKRIKEQAGL